MNVDAILFCAWIDLSPSHCIPGVWGLHDQQNRQNRTEMMIHITSQNRLWKISWLSSWSLSLSLPPHATPLSTHPSSPCICYGETNCMFEQAHVMRNWSFLPTVRWMSLDVTLPVPGKPSAACSPWPTVWLRLLQRLSTKTTQLSCSRLPDLWKFYVVINAVCFKLLELLGNLICTRR